MTKAFREGGRNQKDIVGYPVEIKKLIDITHCTKTNMKLTLAC